MAGIYIHIPFCRTKCDYCNFFSLASQRGKDEIAAVIGREIKLQSTYLSGEQVSSIYFGGGTPTLLPVSDIASILNALYREFRISTDAEITLEANPDDISKEKLQAIKTIGINRLSIGIQSFFPADLHYLNRLHDPAQAFRAIEDTLETGFNNTSIDLIFGIPGQTISGLENNLDIFLSYKIPHLSAYALTIEPSTALAWKIKQNRVKPVLDEEQTAQFLFLMQWMEKQAYSQYEISNYALPGFESRHNSSYWQGEKYLGLGPSAHSFDSISRQWNVSNLTKYMEGITSGKLIFEKEVLTELQHQNEYVMTAIRTRNGINLEYFGQRFGKKALEQLNLNLQTLIDAANNDRPNDWFLNTEGSIVLSRQGKLFADHIAAGLFQQD
jgi:oxygen-independent coproporphyrinogen III oxidase